jgi:D-alanyl-D-alanine carboxypeptidase
MNGDVEVMAGKTGFISKSGYCLATLLRLPQGNPVAVVVVMQLRGTSDLTRIVVNTSQHVQ